MDDEPRASINAGAAAAATAAAARAVARRPPGLLAAAASAWRSGDREIDAADVVEVVDVADEFEFLRANNVNAAFFGCCNNITVSVSSLAESSTITGGGRLNICLLFAVPGLCNGEIWKVSNCCPVASAARSITDFWRRSEKIAFASRRHCSVTTLSPVCSGPGLNVKLKRGTKQWQK